MSCNRHTPSPAGKTSDLDAKTCRPLPVNGPTQCTVKSHYSSKIRSERSAITANTIRHKHTKGIYNVQSYSKGQYTHVQLPQLPRRRAHSVTQMPFRNTELKTPSARAQSLDFPLSHVLNVAFRGSQVLYVFAFVFS